MFNAKKLRRYAEVVVRQGLAVRPGQVVNVSGEVEHLELIRAIVAQSYAAGALYAGCSIIDSFCDREHIVNAPEDSLGYVPRYVAARTDEIVERNGCYARIVGMEPPSLWEGVDSTRIHRVAMAKREANAKFYAKGVNHGAVQWCVVPGATQAWAHYLYPELLANAALAKLWEQLHALVRADQLDPDEAWKQHTQTLRTRREWLDALRIRELRFRGEGTDLTVRLSPKYTFAGGTSKGPSGVEFTPNLPTEEVFTAPDWPGTSGTVRATRPLNLHGKPVRGLVCRFEDGELKSFSAKTGSDAFAALIATDLGARRLGEVALVGIDSPVYRSGLVFNETLLDENAACHVALGLAYKKCLHGGAEMTSEVLKEMGFNTSKIHVDFMISDDRTDVDALTQDGRTVSIIRAGEFVS